LIALSDVGLVYENLLIPLMIDQLFALEEMHARLLDNTLNEYLTVLVRFFTVQTK